MIQHFCCIWRSLPALAGSHSSPASVPAFAGGAYHWLFGTSFGASGSAS
jgi:hypothetical protein